jgi:hypothetical protein
MELYHLYKKAQYETAQLEELYHLLDHMGVLMKPPNPLKLHVFLYLVMSG